MPTQFGYELFKQQIPDISFLLLNLEVGKEKRLTLYLWDIETSKEGSLFLYDSFTNQQE